MMTLVQERPKHITPTTQLQGATLPPDKKKLRYPDTLPDDLSSSVLDQKRSLVLRDYTSFV